MRQISKQIIAKQGFDLSHVVVVLPSRRAATYLRKHLSELIGKPFFAPEIYTFDQWCEMLTDAEIPEQLSLLFRLYEVHQKIAKSDAESFASFSKWGSIMLSDFDEIDSQFIEPTVIFSDLRNIMEIENWSFGEDSLSGQQQNFLQFWNSLPEYYKLYTDHLEKLSLTYRGRAYLNLSMTILDAAKDRYYYFAGFNSLTKSQERIVARLTAEQRACFLPDVDAFYLTDVNHEAGNSLRKTQGKLWDSPLENNFVSTEKRITIIETPGQVMMAKVSGAVLKDMCVVNPDMSKTALVMADETLFVPMLGALPEELDTANITMGYPLRYSSVQSLLDAVFKMQDDLQRIKTGRIYHTPVLNFLGHVYFTAIAGHERQFRSFESSVIASHQAYLTCDMVISKFMHLNELAGLFKIWNEPLRDGLKNLIILVDFLERNCAKLPEPGIEILRNLRDCVDRMTRHTADIGFPVDFKTFRTLFLKSWHYEALSFPGNPLSGVQVLGMLETRAIDFERVVIAGASEGNLPPTGVIQSFIPWDLRKKLGLAIPESRQSESAYHFYRLIARASEVVMLWNSRSDGWSSGEKSRFILQLENDLSKSANHQFRHSVYSPGDSGARTEATTYLVNDEIRNILLEHLETKGLSASALNKLIQCPLDFYYSYVLKIHETEEIEENFESSTFGSKIHEVLHDIFEPFKTAQKPLDVATLENEKKILGQRLSDAYRKQFKDHDLTTGYNKLAFDISVQYLEKLIDRQIAEVETIPYPIQVIALEETMSREFHWKLGGRESKVMLTGNIDRIDEIDGHYRIIDYKSGACDEPKVELPAGVMDPEKMKGLMNHREKGYVRQLLMYSLLFCEKYPEVKNRSAGIISMVNLGQWIQPVNVKGTEDFIVSDEILEAFAEQLEQSLSEIFMDGFVFRHNIQSTFCRQCR